MSLESLEDREKMTTALRIAQIATALFPPEEIEESLARDLDLDERQVAAIMQRVNARWN
jgi:hypothetical protein